MWNKSKPKIYLLGEISILQISFCQGVYFIYILADFFSSSIYRLDWEGNFAGINYNDGVRAPYWNIPVEEVTNGYRALKTFHRTMYKKENCINYKMQKGN